MEANSPQRPIAIDLFAGAGGLSLGLEQAGFDVAAAVELDPIHCAVHEYNFPHCAIVCGSVVGLTGREIRRRAGLGGRNVHLVAGGAPCQGFSMIGKRALDDPRNSLVRHFLRLLVELEANYFIFENVRGLTVGHHRRFLEELIEEAGHSGYNVLHPWQVLNASSFGVPQSRERLFLLGARKGLPLPRYPEPTNASADGGSGDLTGLPVGPTVSDALADVPDAELFEELVESDSVRATFGKPSAYARSLRGLVRDRDDFSFARAFDPSILTSSLRADHTDLSRKRFAQTPPGKVETVSRFYRLDPKGISNTLRAGTASDRGAFTSPRPIHPTFPRCITVREMARLHSFPDWFRLHATKWHGARQIGNSVPPKLARAVASSVIAAMGHRPVVPPGLIELGPASLLNINMAEAAARYGVPFDTIPQRKRNASACMATER